MPEWFLLILAVLAGLALLYLLTFFIRLGRTKRVIGRAVDLGFKHLNNPPLTSAEQAEVDEFCRQGILQEVRAQDQEGKTVVLYSTSQDPILAELSS